MSKSKSHVSSICLLVVITAISMTSQAEIKTLKVCYDQWAPMTMFPTQEALDRGVVIDMLEQIYTAKGYQPEYYEVPLARGLSMVDDGLCDMLPEYLYSADAEKDFEYASQATFVYQTAFVVRRNEKWRYKGMQSIKGKRVATGPGWDYSSMSVEYQQYLDDPKNANFVEVIAGADDVVDRILRMINAHRVDLYADNELVLQHGLNRLKLNDELMIVRPGLEKPLIEIPIFSKKLPAAKRQELINIWDKGRVLMKGALQQKLLEKYHVTID